jgi:hypothetical protein
MTAPTGRILIVPREAGRDDRSLERSAAPDPQREESTPRAAWNIASKGGERV